MVGRPAHMRLRTIFTAASVAAALAVVPGTAFAQTSALQGYSVPASAVQTQLDNSTPASHNTAPASSNSAKPAAKVPASTTAAAVDTRSASKLPFTGLDVGLVVAAGAMLLLLGFGMRRISRPSGTV